MGVCSVAVVWQPAQMGSVMQVTLKLIETFVDKCEDLTLVLDRLVPAMMDPILGDYARNVPDARYALFQSHVVLAQL